MWEIQNVDTLLPLNNLEFSNCNIQLNFFNCFIFEMFDGNPNSKLYNNDGKGWKGGQADKKEKEEKEGREEKEERKRWRRWNIGLRRKSSFSHPITWNITAQHNDNSKNFLCLFHAFSTTLWSVVFKWKSWIIGHVGHKWRNCIIHIFLEDVADNKHFQK